MKNKFKKMLAKKEARKAELGTNALAATDVAVLRGINAELVTLNEDIAELRSTIDAMPDDHEDGEERGLPPGAQPILRGAGPSGAQILSTFGFGEQRGQPSAAPADAFDTVEYREAFRTFAITGEIKPAIRSAMAEYRANAMTQTTDVSAVIPTTIMNEVVRKLTVNGQVYNMVRKLNIPGGVEVPILSLLPVATWIGETVVSDKQKVQANTKVSFSYHGLECRVSISLLANAVTLPGFENTITDLIVEAMIKAIDQAVIKGNGTGKMLGITVDPRVPVAQVVTLTPAEFAKWADWKKKVFAQMPLAYKAGAAFLMASGTFEGYIDGMVDTAGQPIGRTNYGITEGPQERFGGKTVIQVEDDVIAPYDDAAVGDVVAVLCNLQNYGFNSNMQMSMFRFLDHNTNEWVDKAILIADGKLIDPNGVVIVKKGA